MRHYKAVPAILLLVCSASVVVACSVPVFRYALEHWRPDAYVATVFHEGLTEADRSAIKSLQPLNKHGHPTVNLTVNLVDVSKELTDKQKAFWGEHRADQLPSIVLQTPPKQGPAQTIWHAPLNAATAKAVLDSPVRAEINKRLTDGASVVWVLLECGNAEADDAAFDLLTREVKRLETKLELPEVKEEDLDDLSVAPDSLKISFSALRVSRDEAEEKTFTEMLLRVEPDLLDEELRGQPMAFPIFGRGRALYALVGKGIAPDVIEEACQFLCGACQCTVKAQNPGVDILLNIDWDDAVVPLKPIDNDLPPLASLTGFTEAKDDVVSDDMDAKAASVNENGDVSDTTASNSTATETDISRGEAEDATAAADSPEESSQIESPRSGGGGQNVFVILIGLGIALTLAAIFLMPRGN